MDIYCQDNTLRVKWYPDGSAQDVDTDFACPFGIILQMNANMSN